MKKLLLTLFLLAPLIINSQELRTLHPVDNVSKLIHHALAYSQNSIEQKEFNQVFKHEAEAQGFNFTLFEKLEEYPDVLFIFDNYTEALEQARAKHIYPVFVQIGKGKLPEAEGVRVLKVSNPKAAAKKAIKLMKRLYYTGMRPEYSTIFRQGEDGYPEFRIPSVVSLPNGRILAFAEGREEGRTDCAENDIVLKVSDDRGRSWGKLIKVAEYGAYSLNNPTAVYVAETDEVLVIYQSYPPKMNEGIKKTGFAGDDITKIYVSRSRDHGDTWEPLEDITQQTKIPSVSSQASGPGAAIIVVSGPNKGRILVPFNATGGKDGWYNYLVYSDDYGESWGIIEGRSQYGTNESQVVQLGPTDFLVNARCHRFIGSEDLPPKGWNPWDFSKVTRYRGDIPVSIGGTVGNWKKTKVRYDMPDPLCQGSIIRYSGLVGNEKSILLFTNPASYLTDFRTKRAYRSAPPIRINGTMALSYNEGRTWDIRKRFYGNRYTEYQYSVPTNVGGGYIGVIFEASTEIKFALFDMKWLTGGY